MNSKYFLTLLLSSLALASSDLPEITSSSSTTSTTSTSSSVKSSSRPNSSNSASSYYMPSITSSTAGSGGKLPSLTSSTEVVTFTAIVPNTENDPFILRSHHPNGTVFIAVGSIILSLTAILFFYKFYNFLISRRNASRFDEKFDDYYGGSKSMPINNSPDATNNSTYFFDSTLKNDKDNTLSTFQSMNNTTYGDYNAGATAAAAAAGSAYAVPLATKKHAASNSRTSSHNSSSSSSSENDRSSIYFGLNDDMNKLAPQQGRSLRSALNMANAGSTQSLELLTMPKRTARNSFISPINELIEMTNQQQQYGVSGGNHNHNHSTSSLIQGGIHNHNHNRSTSSLIGGGGGSSSQLPSIVVEPPYPKYNTRSPSPSSNTFNFADIKTHSRNPSFNADTVLNNYHHESNSISMVDLTKMIEDSMRSPSNESNNNSNQIGDKNQLRTQKQQQQARPPSMVLESLMKGEEDI